MDDIHLLRSEEEEALFDEMDNESEIFRLIENTVIWTLEKVCHHNWLPMSVYRRPGDPIFSETIGAAIVQVAAQIPFSRIGESFLGSFYNSKERPTIAVWNYIESSARAWFAVQGFNWISLLMYLGGICHLVMFLAAKRSFLNIDDIVLSVTAFLEDHFAFDFEELGGWKAFEKECNIWLSRFSSAVFKKRMRTRPKPRSIFYLPSETSSFDEGRLESHLSGGDMARILSDMNEELNNFQV
ncbi:uncharacterized protein LOC118186189 [Stegodyphus dumicola]|uniref:uncharacterized protein LOC118186189 n=1 Tax=Stegodyphus dumicola TaxID=202533 RepID=UPI0015B209B2|nr:uncharacterized protein LOC118186189 [Stegodyphus dumicola]